MRVVEAFYVYNDAPQE
uniref:Uncharacterized protein n=1 Tax=Rhizophora mucronata TaxID=61149 RepID=A0A2P2N010_RHIMU